MAQAFVPYKFTRYRRKRERIGISFVPSRQRKADTLEPYAHE